MKIIMILLLPLVLFAGNSDLHKIKGLIDKGNFNKATILIDSLINVDNIPSEIVLEFCFFANSEQITCRTVKIIFASINYFELK